MPNTVNISPSFARDAAEQLRNGNVQTAIDLCLAGTKTFPDYATGYFLLGKCYDTSGRTVEALVAYRQALNKLPDNPALQTAVKGTEEREQEEFRRFVKEQQRKLENKKDAISTVLPHTEEPPKQTEESALELLEKKLKNLQRPKPSPSLAPEPGGALQRDDRSVGIVTATMAEIWAGQGQYAQAIYAYRELQDQHPGEKEKYSTRITELEHMLAIQNNEKSLESPQNRKAP